MEALDPIIVVDCNDAIVDVNNEAVRAYGYTREEMLGQSITTVLPRQQRSQILDLLTRCRSGESIRSVPSVRKHRSGDESKVLLTLTLLTDERGEPDTIAVGTRLDSG
jgi:PAS domain S-box-containing protein